MSDPDEENGRTDLDDQSMDEVYDMADELEDSVDTVASPAKRSMGQGFDDNDDDDADLVPYRRKDAPTSVPEASTTRRGDGHSSDNDDEPPEIPGSPMKASLTTTPNSFAISSGETNETNMDDMFGASSEDEYEADKQSRKDRIKDQRSSSIAASEAQANATPSITAGDTSLRAPDHVALQAQPKQIPSCNSTRSAPSKDATAKVQHDAESEDDMVFSKLSKTNSTVRETKPAQSSQHKTETSSSANQSSGAPKHTTGPPASSNLTDVDLPPDILHLLQYIEEFHPETMDIPTTVQPFIPDYVPAIGVPYEGVHVLRPDGLDDPIGVVVLAEPGAVQSHVAELQLMLKADFKPVHADWELPVLSIENAHDHPTAISDWIASVAKIQLAQPLCQVHYTKPFPSLDVLLDVWPAQFEEALAQMPLPPASLNVSLAEYTRIVCGLLDIPVYDGHVRDSLHVLFTLYQAFQDNPHFAHYD